MGSNRNLFFVLAGIPLFVVSFSVLYYISDKKSQASPNSGGHCNIYSELQIIVQQEWHDLEIPLILDLKDENLPDENFLMRHNTTLIKLRENLSEMQRITKTLPQDDPNMGTLLKLHEVRYNSVGALESIFIARSTQNDNLLERSQLLFLESKTKEADIFRESLNSVDRGCEAQLFDTKYVELRLVIQQWNRVSLPFVSDLQDETVSVELFLVRHKSTLLDMKAILLDMEKAITSLPNSDPAKDTLGAILEIRKRKLEALESIYSSISTQDEKLYELSASSLAQASSDERLLLVKLIGIF